MTGQEFREYLADRMPVKLNKFGESILRDGLEPQGVIVDMKAVLK